jgi:hypothetical protein
MSKEKAIMNNLKLARVRKARAAVNDARAAIARDAAAVKAVRDQIAALEAQIAEMRRVSANKGLEATLAAAESALVLAEEETIVALNVELAAEIIQRFHADPVRHERWVVEAVARLRRSVRSELDTPLTQKFAPNPVIESALALVPPPDPMDQPVFLLGGAVGGQTDWPSRRKAILAAAEQAAA